MPVRTLLLLLVAVLAGCAPSERVMVFGDSLAFELAQARDGAAVNAGVPSERVARALIDPAADMMVAGEKRIEIELQQHRPRTVVILIGANDVLEGTWQQTQGRDAGLWLAEFELALARTLASAAPRADRVVVLTIPPQRGGTARRREAYAAGILRANHVIRRVAGFYGVDVVDAHAIVSADMPRYLSGDDVHLTPEGYAEIWRHLR